MFTVPTFVKLVDGAQDLSFVVSLSNAVLSELVHHCSLLRCLGKLSASGSSSFIMFLLFAFLINLLCLSSDKISEREELRTDLGGI